MASHRALGVKEPGSHVLSTFEVPTRPVAANEVHVRPLYIGLNPRVEDLEIMSIDGKRLLNGYGMPPNQFSFVLGGDAYGEVVEAGSESGLKKGAHVCVYGGPVPGRDGTGPNAFGTMQDIIHLPSIRCLPDPPLKPEEAPVYGPAYCTAFSGVAALMKLLELSDDGTDLNRTDEADVPILVFGGASSVGAFAIQLLALAGYTNIISTASPKNHAYVKSLGAKHVFDYSSSELVESIRKVAGRQFLPHVFDGVSTKGSASAISQLVDPSSNVALTVAGDMPKLENEGVQTKNAFAISYLEVPKLRDALLPKLTPALINKGLRPSPTELIEGGSLTERLMRGIERLHEGQVSARKLIVKWE